jgi:hypothetical protein
VNYMVGLIVAVGGAVEATGIAAEDTVDIVRETIRRAEVIMANTAATVVTDAAVDMEEIVTCSVYNRSRFIGGHSGGCSGGCGGRGGGCEGGCEGGCRGGGGGGGSGSGG